MCPRPVVPAALAHRLHQPTLSSLDARLRASQYELVSRRIRMGRAPWRAHPAGKSRAREDPATEELV
jgi:hypothetical protein